MEFILNLVNKLSTFDTIYFFTSLYFVIQCTKKGFVISLLSASKWLLAYIVTIYLFPKLKPFVDGIIDNEYVLDILLGVGLFIIIIFLILIINRSISNAVKFSGLGSLDRLFGFFFGFVKAYIVIVCVYTTIDIIYNNSKWPINLKKAISYEWVEKGSNYLIKGFPNQKEYENAKDKVQEL